MLNCLKHSKVKESIVVLLSFFLLWFPKGGFKLHEIPLTWGYLFLAIVGCISVVARRLLLEKRAIFCLLALIPFQVVSLITILIQGQTHLGYVFSYLIHFFVLPLLFFLVFPSYIDAITIKHLFKWIKRGVCFIAMYGLFLFIYKILRGSFIEIPFLTVNYHDRNELEYGKCIDRGGIFKLISTYNNGNLYGICMLMFLPLYEILETKLWKKWIVKTSLVLTLSRTIWIGLMIYEIFTYFAHEQKIRIRVIKMVGSLCGIGSVFFVLNNFFPFSSEFLWDPFLGNRIGQLDVLKYIEWFSTQPFNGIYEVIYLGVLFSFGVVGLITFLFGMIFPLVYYFLHTLGQKRREDEVSIAFGLILYLVIACSDGALLLIPVMCFYWFLTLVLMISIRLNGQVHQREKHLSQLL